MSTAINVNKQSVEQLLGSGKNKPFVIPEYQRPYAWTSEQVETLFNDLWDFTTNEGGSKNDGTYFLGSIVSYENNNGEQEIIDGQQRITSLFLLLRAMYTILQKPETKTPEAINFIGKIEPAIWRTDKLTGQVEYSNILLSSRVINNEGNEILINILKTGETSKNATDNYSKNYNLFRTLFEKHSAENPLMIYQFIYAILNQAILLPISADTQDTALTIFSTLNDRGLPLSDSDIFKAKIYGQLNDIDKKNEFIENWKKLEEDAAEAFENIQQLFYYNMFYLRAIEEDKATTTPGLRKYYAIDNFKKLADPALLSTLNKILELWIVINKREEVIGEAWSKNQKILQALDVLTSYPNEFWKYPVVVFYLSHNSKDSFEEDFLCFLQKLIVSLVSKYLVMPTINAVKSDILKLNIEATKSQTPAFEFKGFYEDVVKDKIKSPHRNLVRMLLKVLAYSEQTELLPSKWEVEHIFPQKWQSNYFPSEDADTIKEKIEQIGNKIPFEKKLNIIAGNGYFIKKKQAYLSSIIEITKELGKCSVAEWKLEDITERNIRVADKLFDILNQWNIDYLSITSKHNTPIDSELQLSVEELEAYEKFKAMGLIK